MQVGSLRPHLPYQLVEWWIQVIMDLFVLSPRPSRYLLESARGSSLISRSPDRYLEQYISWQLPQ